MASREHQYAVTVTWTGNTGKGTADYRSYERAHDIDAANKPSIPGSSDPAFRGDRARWNPEELLVASASACHKLWYLHFCAVNGLVVTAYVDDAEGVMEESASGGGRFTRITLKPRVTFKGDADLEKADALHHKAHEACFIANSLNFPIDVEPSFVTE